MKRRLTTISLLVIAIFLYIAGMALPATLLLVLGAVAEIAFWIRLFRTSPNRGPQSAREND